MKKRSVFILESNLLKAFGIALARSNYRWQSDWLRDQMIKFCLEYAPQDLKELTGIEKPQGE